ARPRAARIARPGSRPGRPRPGGCRPRPGPRPAPRPHALCSRANGIRAARRRRLKARPARRYLTSPGPGRSWGKPGVTRAKHRGHCQETACGYRRRNAGQPAYGAAKQRRYRAGRAMFSSGDEVLRYIQSEGVQFVDVRFCDLPGSVQHFTIPAEAFGENVFSDGLMFDGSSIRGFQEIHESDMLLLPDPSTAVIDPFRTHKTLNLTFFVHDPLTGEPYTRDPRNIARKAQDYLRGSGIADTAYFGPEAEFYIFDSARFATSP